MAAIPIRCPGCGSTKIKWYDFRAMFRRDENFFDYNLLANPLNPSIFPSGLLDHPPCTRWRSSTPRTRSIYDRHMQDYDLTLLPQSRVRFRVGYSAISRGGPASRRFMREPSTLLSTDVQQHHKLLPLRSGLPRPAENDALLRRIARLLEGRQIATDNNFQYQLANGTPVDLGDDFQGTTPCANPVTSTATTPPTVTSNCNGTLSYGLVGESARFISHRTIQFSIELRQESLHVRLGGLQQRQQTMNDLNENFNGWMSRTAHARKYDRRTHRCRSGCSANANWSGEYRDHG